jgi:hypothetical protein
MPLLRSSRISTGPALAVERRTEKRFPCARKADCQPITQLEVGNLWPVQLLDVSNTGVCLRLSRRFEPGTLLALGLAPDNGLALARIRHVRPRGSYWLLGCTWTTELSNEDLRPLVNPGTVSDRAA